MYVGTVKTRPKKYPNASELRRKQQRAKTSSRKPSQGRTAYKTDWYYDHPDLWNGTKKVASKRISQQQVFYDKNHIDLQKIHRERGLLVTEQKGYGNVRATSPGDPKHSLGVSKLQGFL